MLYHVEHWNPRPEMSGAGFSIALYPDWKRAISLSGLTQANMCEMLKNHGPAWLENHGFDPELFIFKLRIQWGEWGPEHLSVPGNACGLDIDWQGMGKPVGGAILTPHNVDSITQASLLLTMFSFVANHLILQIGLGKINLSEAASSTA